MTKPDVGVPINYFESMFWNSRQNTFLLMDLNGIITSVNPAFTKYFGYELHDIAGKSIEILFTDEDKSKGLPEKELSNVKTLGVATDNNYLVHRNGQKTWVNGESILAKNSEGDEVIVKMILEIHAQKTTELELKSMCDFNESILGSINDVVIVLTPEMKILKANKAFGKLFQKEVAIEMMDFEILMKPYDKQNDLIESIKSTIITRKEFSFKRIEIATAVGEKRIYDLSCSPMEDENVLLVVHDITVQYNAEKQREDIIGFVAHELRNPLANIILCNELLGSCIEEDNPAGAKAFLTRSNTNVMRLNKMIGELYDATKISSGNIALEMATFNFEEMVKEAISTIEVLQPDYKINMKGNANIAVTGDRFRLIQVVTNYLSNGIKYSLGSDEVILNVAYDDHMITVSVIDRGLGIPKDQLPLIFSRFFRAEKTKNLEGIGLGLYLCKKIISGHNGKVWVESEENMGSTFYFSIPIKKINNNGFY